MRTLNDNIHLPSKKYFTPRRTRKNLNMAPFHTKKKMNISILKKKILEILFMEIEFG